MFDFQVPQIRESREAYIQATPQNLLLGGRCATTSRSFAPMTVDPTREKAKDVVEESEESQVTRQQ